MENHFIEGIKHITDFEGYDHMLFLIALCAPFTIKQWKPVVLLATAFTLGHSISLALAAFEMITFNREIIELLIPVSIFLTALFNLILPNESNERVPIRSYLITTAFGLIHGMGFSSFFRMISDSATSLVHDLLFFNLGVETGQIIIILIFLLIVYAFTRFGVKHSIIKSVVSTMAMLVSMWLIFLWF